MWQTLNAWLLELPPYMMAFIAKKCPLLVTLCSQEKMPKIVCHQDARSRTFFLQFSNFSIYDFPGISARSSTPLILPWFPPYGFPWFWGVVSPPMLPIFSTFFSAFWGGQKAQTAVPVQARGTGVSTPILQRLKSSLEAAAWQRVKHSNDNR